MLVGPFLCYYKGPEEHLQGKVLKEEEGFLFLDDFELSASDQPLPAAVSAQPVPRMAKRS